MKLLKLLQHCPQLLSQNSPKLCFWLYLVRTTPSRYMLLSSFVSILHSLCIKTFWDQQLTIQWMTYFCLLGSFQLWFVLALLGCLFIWPLVLVLLTGWIHSIDSASTFCCLRRSRFWLFWSALLTGCKLLILTVGLFDMSSSFWVSTFLPPSSLYLYLFIFLLQFVLYYLTDFFTCLPCPSLASLLSALPSLPSLSRS